METWYKVSFYGSPIITKVEAERSTDKFIVLKSGRRESKESCNVVFKSTVEECHDLISENLKRKIEAAQNRIDYAYREIEAAKELLENVCFMDAIEE